LDHYRVVHDPVVSRADSGSIAIVVRETRAPGGLTYISAGEPEVIARRSDEFAVRVDDRQLRTVPLRTASEGPDDCGTVVVTDDAGSRPRPG